MGGFGGQMVVEWNHLPAHICMFVQGCKVGGSSSRLHARVLAWVPRHRQIVRGRGVVDPAGLCLLAREADGMPRRRCLHPRVLVGATSLLTGVCARESGGGSRGSQLLAKEAGDVPHHFRLAFVRGRVVVSR